MLTKLDVLSDFDRDPGLRRLRLPDGSVIDEMPMTQTDFHHAQPVYEEFPGWREDISEARDFDDLPKNARKYIEALQEHVRRAVQRDRRRARPRPVVALRPLTAADGPAA